LMNWMVGGFVFRRSDSPYHRIDPRVKLLISLLLFTASIVAPSIPDIVVIVAFILGLGAVAKILKRITRTAALTAAFALFIFVLNVLITRDIPDSVLYAIRFIAIVVSTSLFFITTSPDELEQVMRTFRLPHDLVFAFVTAVRFVPVMFLDAVQIMDAQKSRGLEMQKGSFVARIRNLIPVLIPLVVNSVIRSGELAEAMESRGYGAVPKPTTLYGNHATNSDKAVALVSVLAFVLTLYAFYFVIPVRSAI
jgi:energy-coupling factor transport system permease protein